jgi:hypothetical protein
MKVIEAEIVEMRKAGRTRQEIADHFDLSKRLSAQVGAIHSRGPYTSSEKGRTFTHIKWNDRLRIEKMLNWSLSRRPELRGWNCFCKYCTKKKLGFSAFNP